VRSISAKDSVQGSIGLVLAGAARDYLVAALDQAGYEVHVAANISRVRSLLARQPVDAWIFDARADDILDLLLTTDCFLLPADNIPDSTQSASFSLWVEGLMTQLQAALSGGAARSGPGQHRRWHEVQGVWLLAGSAGATGAIQTFLNAFTKPPPVAFIYAQHLDPAQQHQLLSFTVQNKLFSLSVTESVQTLAPGRLVMISPRYAVALNEFGQLTTTRRAWSGQHTPDINELLVILSAANLPAVGVIIFSGMGSDGAESLRIFEAAGGRVWAQAPASAVCPGMPQAAFDTGLVQKSGNPVELALALEALYSP
jgi:chemosensory pili system protein ChpB (putative protein-glutamate methylesterase)